MNLSISTDVLESSRLTVSIHVASSTRFSSRFHTFPLRSPEMCGTIARHATIISRSRRAFFVLYQTEWVIVPTMIFLESAMGDTNEQNLNNNPTNDTQPTETKPTETLSDGLVSRMELVEPLNTAGGAVLNELRLDFSKIRGRDYALISRIESRLKGDTLSLSAGSLNKQASPEWRCAVSWVAAIRGTKGLCLDDIDALSLHDLLALESEAIPFLVRSVSKPSSGTPS